MFAATITLTINAVAHVLNRVNQDAFGSEYRYSGTLSSITMKIRHTTDSADSDGLLMLRHNVFVERVIYPTATELLKKETTTFTLRGGSREDPVLTSQLGSAVVTWLNTGTNVADLSVGIN